MFFFQTTRDNGIAYLIWRWILRKQGAISALMDSFYFGSSRGMNDYNKLAARYSGSNVKPDKQFSILPTVMRMLGPLSGKTVIDYGCGAGFFTLPIAEAGASVVCGVDNSEAQIKLASKVAHHPLIHYRVGDVFTQQGGPVDVINVPFVANYARTVNILRRFFRIAFNSLKQGGKAVFVVDLPNGRNLERFGAIKSLEGSMVDETPICIDLFNAGQQICTLNAVYYTPETINRLLLEVGFTSVEWHTPIVSQEGIRQYGQDFWGGYLRDPELGYLTATK
ncbi:MAG: hypothetical protein RLY57_137 [Candidatus Parcubacteria bacterium]|jgi:SAM-dependent methyltransferase